MEEWPGLKADYPDIRAAYWIGQFAIEQGRRSGGLLTIIHSLDRLSLVKALAEGNGPGRTGRIACFLQVNIGERNPKKGGCDHQGRSPTASNKPGNLVHSGAADGGSPGKCNPVPYSRACPSSPETRSTTDFSMGMSGDFESANQLGRHPCPGRTPWFVRAATQAT